MQDAFQFVTLNFSLANPTNNVIRQYSRDIIGGAQFGAIVVTNTYVYLNDQSDVFVVYFNGTYIGDFIDVSIFRYARQIRAYGSTIYAV
jgi:hypothetical protein